MAGLMDLFNSNDPAKNQALGMALLSFGSNMMQNSRGLNPTVGGAMGASIGPAFGTYQQGMNQAGMNKALEAKDTEGMMTALGGIQDPAIQSMLMKYRLEQSSPENQMKKALFGQLTGQPIASNGANADASGATGPSGGQPVNNDVFSNPLFAMAYPEQARAINEIRKSDPKYIADVETKKREAENLVKAKEGAPDFLAKATQIKRNVEDLVNHPGFETSVGAKGPSRLFGADAIFGGAAGGTDAASFDARLDQVKGQQFLQAFETLKGGGQITEVEGAKATAAISRMNRAQTESEFKDAAKEFIDTVDGAMQRARSKAGISISNEAPTSGNVVSYQDYFK